MVREVRTGDDTGAAPTTLHYLGPARSGDASPPDSATGTRCRCRVARPMALELDRHPHVIGLDVAATRQAAATGSASMYS